MAGLISYLSLLTALAIGTLLRPGIGVAGILCLFGLKQWGQYSTSLFAEYRQFTNLAIGVLTVLGVIRYTFRRSCVFCRLPATAILVMALYGYALVTTIWAPDTEASLDQWAIAGPYLITIALLAPLLVSDLGDVRQGFLWTLYIGGTICLLMLLFGRWGLRGLLLDEDYAIETNSLALADLGGSLVLIAAMLALEKRQLLLRVIAIASIPIALGVILKSGSRGQLISVIPSFAIAGSIAFRLRNARSLIALVLMTTIVVALGWWISTLIEINESRWTSTEKASQSATDRLDMASALLSATLAHPFTTLFGLGNSSAYQIIGIYPHITILEVLAEEGLPGIVLYLGILACTVRSIVRISGTLPERSSDRNTFAIAAAMFFFNLFVSWKQGTLVSSYYVFAFAIILARLEPQHAALRSSAPSASTATPAVALFPNLLR
jgi:hypothetical protein